MVIFGPGYIIGSAFYLTILVCFQNKILRYFCNMFRKINSGVANTVSTDVELTKISQLQKHVRFFVPLLLQSAKNQEFTTEIGIVS